MADSSEVQIDQIKAVNHHLWMTINLMDEGAIIIQADPLENPGPLVVFANKAMEKFTGRTNKQLVGLPISKIYPGEELDALFSHLQASITFQSSPLTNLITREVCSHQLERVLQAELDPL